MFPAAQFLHSMPHILAIPPPVGIEIREILMPADVVSMDVGRSIRDGLVGQLARFFIDIANSQAGVNQQSPFPANQ